MECARCRRPAGRGVLCEPCAEGLARAPGLLPEHVVGRRPGTGGGAWLVDGFGVPHRLHPTRTVVGRGTEAGLGVQHGSVSRDHAELRRTAGGWELRDLASRNGTFVDDAQITGRVTVGHLAAVRFGGVGFLLVESAVELPAAGPASIETSRAAAGAAQYHVAGDEVELCLLATGSPDDGGGVLLHRRRGASAWSELELPRLEHQLLQLLCEQAAGDRSPSTSRGAVPTRALIKKLAFQSRFANDENVRQVVRRLRTSLGEIGAESLLGTVPGRGYFVAWPVTVRAS